MDEQPTKNPEQNRAIAGVREMAKSHGVSLPCSDADAIRLAQAGGYICSQQYISSHRAHGTLPPNSDWSADRLICLLMSLEAREKWAPGANNHAKNPARMAVEMGMADADPMIQNALQSVRVYDSELLLMFLRSDELSNSERDACVEILRLRLGYIQQHESAIRKTQQESEQEA